MKYFCNVTAWNESPGTHKNNTQLIRLFFDINQTRLLLNKQNNKDWQSDSDHVYVCSERHITLERRHPVGSQDPGTIILGISFPQKLPESSDSIYSSILMLKNVWYHNIIIFTWSGPNSVPVMCCREKTWSLANILSP